MEGSEHLVLSYVSSAWRMQQHSAYTSGRQNDFSLLFFLFLLFFPGFTKSLQLTDSCWVVIRDQMCCKTSCSPVLPSVPQPDLVLSDAYSLGGPWLTQPMCSDSPLNSVCSCANWLVCCSLDDKTTEVLRTMISAWRNQGWECRGWL